MSSKATNGIKLTMSDSSQWKSGSLLDTSVKFAGEEAKDRLYEPKHKKKLVRVLTVVAYVFFVSLAAIMLSLYYVFLWNGDQKMAAKYVTRAPTAEMYYAQNCKNLIAGMQQQITALELDESLSVPTRSENNSTTSTIRWQDDYNDSLESPKKSSMLIQKLWNEEKYEDTY
ncbi:uncharacterized protein LOC130443937 isoform X2 [Diorhabda sublineata]|uniref:uncharacterized protein LOC130443937 isoform X2 n=1 Tax=Diorhabda sublineata TaxID=1163346 RepID=UPI0024E0C476|nr:uncharacterized protein LOC130443937 isoform X2 [Diorhabda sublineata]